MRTRFVFLIPGILLCLLLAAGCGRLSPPTEDSIPATESAASEATKAEGAVFAPGAPCEPPELSDGGLWVTLHNYKEADQKYDLWQWSYRFVVEEPITYDMEAPPVRFADDKSLWMTYQRDGDSDNCLMGRCIRTQGEWAFMERVLFAPEYQSDPEYTVPFGTPEFLLRQGTDCSQCTTRIPPGQTGYIDDELCRFCVSPDGSVLRLDADGSIFRSAAPLEPEDVARLYLIYESYYRAWTRQVVFPYNPEVPREELRLLVRTADREISVPPEKWDAFLALVSREEDKEIPEDLPCFKVIQQLFVTEDYPAPELLRFRFLQTDDDPDSMFLRWFSLREDGKITVDSPWGGSLLRPLAAWTVGSPVRHISKISFDAEAIATLVLGE